MLNLERVTICLYLCSFLCFSCGSNSKAENKPNNKLAADYGIDATKLVYQYYQKFGFTDLCEDLRMVSKQEVSPEFTKKLPFSTDDLKTINGFSNKIDSINGQRVLLNSSIRKHFYDVELEFVEYVTDSTFSVELTNGEYEIIETELKSVIKVYDRTNDLLYIESHSCGGK